MPFRSIIKMSIRKSRGEILMLSDKYDRSIEQKWQKYWADNQTYKFDASGLETGNSKLETGNARPIYSIDTPHRSHPASFTWVTFSHILFSTLQPATSECADSMFIIRKAGTARVFQQRLKLKRNSAAFRRSNSGKNAWNGQGNSSHACASR